MPQAKPLKIPQTVPELQKLVAELQEYIDKRRAQKKLSMARWRVRQKAKVPRCTYYKCKQAATERFAHLTDKGITGLYCEEHATRTKNDPRGNEFRFEPMQEQTQ